MHAPEAAPAPIWSVQRTDDLAWRAWDGDVLLYDARTGDLHYFDAATSAVLLPLLGRPCARQELVLAAAEALDVVADAEAAAMVDEILRTLRWKDLVTD